MSFSFRRRVAGLVLACVVGAVVAPPDAAGQTGTNALSYSDVDFLKQLYQDVITSHRLAGLAVNDGKKPEVRQLAASVTDTLRQARERIKILAAQKGVEITDELIAQNQNLVDRQSDASYDDFDRTYIDTLLTNLPKILQACQSTAAGTQDPDLKAFLTVIIPSIESRIAAVKTVKAAL